MEEISYFYPEGHRKHFEGGHPEAPERVEVIVKALEKVGYWSKGPHLSPTAVPEEILENIHSSEYLNVLQMACRRGSHLDSDTYTTPASWDLALHSAGGAISVATEVWTSQSRRGFALTRPPGHHATRGQGMGFCLLNNIAVAAEFLIEKHGAKRIAIVDLDLHHGNGTQDIFWERGDVFYISTHQSPLYPGTGYIDEIGIGEGKGTTANFPLPRGSGDLAFMNIMQQLIIPLLDRYQPEIVLISYGFDVHWSDPLGQLLLSAGAYGEIVKQLADWADIHCGGRIAIFLEGGYNLEAASACTTAVIAHGLIGDEVEDSMGPCPYPEGSTWKTTFERAKIMWGI